MSTVLHNASIRLDLIESLSQTFPTGSTPDSDIILLLYLLITFRLICLLGYILVWLRYFVYLLYSFPHCSVLLLFIKFKHKFCQVPLCYDLTFGSLLSEPSWIWPLCHDGFNIVGR